MRLVKLLAEGVREELGEQGAVIWYDSVTEQVNPALRIFQMQLDYISDLERCNTLLAPLIVTLYIHISGCTITPNFATEAY